MAREVPIFAGTTGNWGMVGTFLDSPGQGLRSSPRPLTLTIHLPMSLTGRAENGHLRGAKKIHHQDHRQAGDDGRLGEAVSAPNKQPAKED